MGRPSALNAHAQSRTESFEKRPPASTGEAKSRIEEMTGIVRGETQIRAFMKRIGMRRLKLEGVPGKVDQSKKQEQREFLEDRLSPALNEAERGERKMFLRTVGAFRSLWRWTTPATNVADRFKNLPGNCPSNCCSYLPIPRISI